LALTLSVTPAESSNLPPEHQPKHGICGVISDGEVSTWMIDLAKTGEVVVHCIAPDENAADKIARAADKAGVGGKLLVESIPVKPLPYRDYLLNCLVVEKSEGLDFAAALKTVAPGGKLCRLEGGQWKVTVRKRPEGMDEWTHNYRDAGGNSGVSTDKFVKFPLGLRWNDDLPFNLSTSLQSSNSWTNTRAIAVVDGRVYYITNCARENLRRTGDEMRAVKVTQDQYLIARDAWNGTPIWRRKLGDIFYGGLFYTARAPMVAMNGKLYAVTRQKELLEIDGATGKTLQKFNTDFLPSIVMVLDDTLVAACWKEGHSVGGLTGVDRRPMDINVEEGTLVAFNLKNGSKIWEHKKLATSMRGADGRVYIVHREGQDKYSQDKYERARRRGKYKDYDRDKPKEMQEKYGSAPGRGNQTAIAIDVKSGKILWEVGAAELKLQPVDHLAINLAGKGAVVIGKNTLAITNAPGNSGREAIILRGASGTIVFRKNTNSFAALYDGKINIDRQAFAPDTGEKSEKPGIGLRATVCTPQVYVNGMTTNNRGCNYTVDGKSVSFGAARGSCMFAAIPAHGAFFTCQTYCACAPGTVPGFISFGSIHTEPTSAQMLKAPRIFKGPSYGKQTSTGTDGWFTYMGNGKRNNSNTAVTLPVKMAAEWNAKIAEPISDSTIEGSWKDSLSGLLTAPVVSGGLVFAADRHRHKVVALKAEDGSLAWEKFSGGRITTPPTIYDGLCMFGSSDGYVRALDVSDGSLAWKMRMGPEERRMVSYAQLESPWSVISSVLVSEDGIAYASAGKSTGAEGGIVVRAFVPKTGEVKWSRDLAYLKGRSEHVNDVMYIFGDNLYVMKSALNLETGKFVENPRVKHDLAKRAWQGARRAAIKEEKPVPPEPELPEGLAMVNTGIEGMANPNWTKLGTRRKRAIEFENVRGMVLGWDDSIILAANGGGINASSRKARPDKDTKIAWTNHVGGDQVTAVAIGKNAIVCAGGHFGSGGQSEGFVRIVDRKTGKLLDRRMFSTPLSYQGLAVTDGKIYATFEDGTLVCLKQE
jgi:outer membrane protein assembly factor BamB